jgi:hypothetical protein
LVEARPGGACGRRPGRVCDCLLRVENKRVDEFENMTDEELRQYVYGNKELDGLMSPPRAIDIIAEIASSPVLPTLIPT